MQAADHGVECDRGGKQKEDSLRELNRSEVTTNQGCRGQLGQRARRGRAHQIASFDTGAIEADNAGSTNACDVLSDL